MKKLILLPILLFAGCPALETSAPVAAVGGMEVAFKATSEAFKKFISNEKLKIDEELRAWILSEIAKDAEAFEEMKQAHEAWTNAASSVNVEEVLKQLKAIYDLVMESV